MFTEEYAGINSFLKEASNLLLKHGMKRNTRGFTCIELPEPFIFKITNPRARFVTIPERKWNPILPFAESLWLATGRNDLNFIGHYLENMKNFSDDGLFLRGGYGPRLRKYNGISDDYKINSSTFSHKLSTLRKTELDQFDYVLKVFAKDENTRQAIITIGDPPKDCFEENGVLKSTKDYPCTRLLHFQKQANSNKLNLTVYMRSNDILWGASAVNIFNYTLIQEYFSHILGFEVGDYYHISNCFHFYENFTEQLINIAASNEVSEEYYNYEMNFNSLENFDSLLLRLSSEETKLRENKHHGTIIDFEDDFFNDWYKIFYCFNLKKKVDFKNPILNKLFQKYMKHE